MFLIVSAADVSLFHVATRIYGDATQWITLSVANSMPDPRITGILQLYIPPVALFPSGGAQRQ